MAKIYSDTVQPGWIGIVEGKPYFEKIADTYGDVIRAEIFPVKAEAQNRFERIARVLITEAPRKRK